MSKTHYTLFSLGRTLRTVLCAAASGAVIGSLFLAGAPQNRPGTIPKRVLRAELIQTLPYPVINSRTPGAAEIPGGFEGGTTIKINVRGKPEYHMFASAFETPGWDQSRLDHWSSQDGLRWRHVATLYRTWFDKQQNLWMLPCAPMPFYDESAERWLIYYPLFPFSKKAWQPHGIMYYAESTVKGRDGIDGPYRFPGTQVLFEGNSYPKGAIVDAISAPYVAKDGRWTVFYTTDATHGGSSHWKEIFETVHGWEVALASAPAPRGPYTPVANGAFAPMIEPQGFVENPVPVRVRGATTGAPYWVATFDFLNPEIRSLGKQNHTMGLTWSDDGVQWPASHGQAVDLSKGLAGKDPWWNVIRTPHGLIDEGDGTYTCFFTATSRQDRGFRGLGMAKLRLVEAAPEQ